MQKILERGILFLLFLVPFIPFVVARSMYFPFITGKAFAFRILVGIALALWLALMVYDRSYVPKKSPVLWSVLVFFGIVALADIFGVNFERSLWSNFERMEGLVTFLYLCVFFLVSSTILTKTNKWPAFWNTSIVASVGLAFFALFQVMGLIGISQGGARVDATLGNSIYLAVYMLFHIFLTLWLLYEKRSSRPLLIFYTMAVVLQTAALYYTGTRGAMLGLLGGLGLSALLVAWRGREHPRLRKISLGVIVAIVFMVGLFASIKNTQFVQESEMLRRFTNISLTDGTVQSRLVLWSGVALPGFYERPILGWGQDNFIVVFGKHYDARMYKQEPWFDRAHNVFFDWLISAGVLGLLSYLSLFGVALFVLWKKSAHLSVPERALGTGLLAGYFVHNIFVFDHLISYVFFFLFLGFVASAYARDEGETEDKGTKTRGVESFISDPTLRRTAAVGVSVVALIAVYATTIPHITASQNIIKSIMGLQTGDFTGPLERFEYAIDDPVADDEARSQLSRVAFTVAAATNPIVTEEIKQQYRQKTLEELQKSVAEDPTSTRPKYFLAIFHARTGNFPEAIRLFEELLLVNPDRQIFLSEYGLLLGLVGDTARSEEVLKHFFTISPESDEAAARYSAALFVHGKTTEASDVLTEYAGEILGDRPILLSTYPRPENFDDALKITSFEIMRFQLRREDVGFGGYLLRIRDMANRGNKTEALILADDAAVFYPEHTDKTGALKAAIRAGQEIIIEDSSVPAN